MYWYRQKISYDILIPPLKKPFEKFTPKEAEDYFIWHKNQLKNRIEYLQNFSGVNLNYSINSLNDIWNWFLKNAKIEKTPAIKIKELKSQLKNQPREIVNDILSEQSKQFSLETEYIMRDIAMYFGELYIRNNPSISWGFHTDVKVDSFANMPLLIGFEDRDFTPPFKVHFEPVFMIRGLACNLFDGEQKKEDLLDLYNKWQRMVFNNSAND